jgi:hypothetical protein
MMNRLEMNSFFVIFAIYQDDLARSEVVYGSPDSGFCGIVEVLFFVRFHSRFFIDNGLTILRIFLFCLQHAVRQMFHYVKEFAAPDTKFMINSSFIEFGQHTRVGEPHHFSTMTILIPFAFFVSQLLRFGSTLSICWTLLPFKVLKT